MENENVESGVRRLKKGPKFGVRHIQMILCLLLVTIGYTTRVNLSVAIVAMTDNTTSSNPDIPTYDWEDTSVILSSFFWGYVVLQGFAGHWARKYGPTWFMVGAMTINSLASIFVPTLTDSLGAYGVYLCRIVQGLSQGLIFPMIHTLLGQWVPVSERSTTGTVVYSGVALGTILSLIITSAISASWAGWPASFYLFGALGLVWVVAWLTLGSNKPAEHLSMSDEERIYIQTSLGQETHVEQPTPWREIFRSMPVWAIIVGSFGQNWGYAMLLTHIPIYMNKVMGFKTESIAYSAAPYVALAICSYIFGPISDYLTNKKHMTRGNVRKLMNSIGTIIPAISLVAVGFVPEDQPYASLGLLTVTVGINAAVSCGFQVNPVDLSPNHSGTLMGIAHGSSNVFSIISIWIVRAIVTRQTDKSLWRIVFITASAIYVISDVFYVIFASGEVQSWNSEIKPGPGIVTIQDTQTNNSNTSIDD